MIRTRKLRVVWWTLAGAIAAPVLSVVFAGLLTFDSLGYWANAITALLAFLLAAWISSMMVGRFAALAVSICMGVTWGTIVVVLLLSRPSGHEPVRSPLVVLGYVAASIVLAYFLGKRHRVRTPDND